MITFKGKSYADIEIAALLSGISGLLLFGAVFVSPTSSLYRTLFFIVLVASPFLGRLAMRIVLFLSKKNALILRLAKFSLIGGTSSLLEFFILNFLFAVTGITSGLYYSFFKALTFIIALLNSYFWNRSWTFEKENDANKKEFGAFFVANLIGLCINVGTASLVVNGIGAPSFISPYAWANVGVLVAVCVTMTWNYLSYALFVFKK